MGADVGRWEPMDGGAGTNHRGNRSGGAGLLGVMFWFIGLLIAAIIGADYDPEAADFRDRAEEVRAVVISTDLAALVVDHDGEPTTVPLQPRDVGRFAVGDTVLVLIASPTEAQLSEDAPPSPQRAGAFVLPAVLLGLGALLVSFDPEILYPEASRER